MAFEVLESPEGEVIEIKPQEELASTASRPDWCNNSTVYIMLPASSINLSQDNTSKGVISEEPSGCMCCGANGFKKCRRYYTGYGKDYVEICNKTYTGTKTAINCDGTVPGLCPVVNPHPCASQSGVVTTGVKDQCIDA
jgi:hypothetical protein